MYAVALSFFKILILIIILLTTIPTDINLVKTHYISVLTYAGTAKTKMPKFCFLRFFNPF